MNKPGLFRAILDVLPPRELTTVVVVGCGPSTPNHEIDWFLKNYPKSHVIGFEACPENYASLCGKYISERRVDLYSDAVGSFNGTTKFYINHLRGTHSLLEWKEDSLSRLSVHTTVRIIDVPICTLDTFCAQHDVDHIDILFMDAQNAEPFVLHGARELLHSQRITVVVGEAIFTDIHGYEDCFVDAYTMLTEAGLYKFHGFYRLHYGARSMLRYCDYVFTTK